MAGRLPSSVWRQQRRDGHGQDGIGGGRERDRRQRDGGAAGRARAGRCTASRAARPARPACSPSRPTCRTRRRPQRRCAGVDPDAVFITTWLRQDSEAENIRVNAAMVRNLLDGLRRAGRPRHVALVTGLKHYLGPFEAYGKGALPQTPFREEQGRLDVENFYYAQEDEVFAAAARDGFTWSVHRPHTVIGKAVGNAMNMGTTLAVYATLCRETGRPFRFPGSAAQWNGLTDMTDARPARPPPALGGHDAGGARPGVQRRQRRRLPLAVDVGAHRRAGSGSSPRRSTARCGRWSSRWRTTRRCGGAIAEREGLAEPDLARLASPWHTDADLGRPIEVVTDMSKSRRLGFTAYQPTDDAFFALFEQLRADRLIP